MGNLGLPAAAGSMTMITCNMPDHPFNSAISCWPHTCMEGFLVADVQIAGTIGLTVSSLENDCRSDKSLHMSAESLASGHSQVRNRTDLVFY
jgi:hypothetical protein